MLKASYCLAVLLGFSSLVDASSALTPGAPFTIISAAELNPNHVATSIATSSTGTGFFVTCMDSDENLCSRFYDISSATWSPALTALPNIVSSSSTNIAYSTTILGSSSSTTSAATWVSNSIGYNTGVLNVGFPSDEGQMWTVNAPITALFHEIYPNIGVAVVNDKTLVTWLDQTDPTTRLTPNWAWTTNNGSMWNSGTIPNTMSLYVNYCAITVAGTNAGFMATWANNDFNLYSSFSSDGTSWSAMPLQITTSNDVDLNSTSNWICANESGFMTVWMNDTTPPSIYSSFYDLNNPGWTEPTLIVLEDNYVESIPTVAATSSGFVAAWIDGNANLFVSFSSDNGTTWSPPTAIVSDGSAANDGCSGQNCMPYYVGISTVGDTTLFTWLDQSGDAMGSLIGFSSSPRSFKRPSNRR